MSNSFDPGLDEIYNKIVAGDKVFLSRAITWVESSNKPNRKRAIKLLARIHQNPPVSLRIAVTGPPGAGKSTLIDHLGYRLILQGHKVAVLAIDPSSTESYGSILGDKTRMKRLANHPSAYIRPSPTGLELGGVNHHTRESILLCEAAGFDVVFIETVGVGQSEVMAKTITDLFLLVLNPGGGDDLQGIKKGVVELADIIAINKSDGSLQDDARRMKNMLSQSSKVIENNFNQKYKVSLILTSALNGFQIDILINEILTWLEYAKNSGQFQLNRKNQLKHWYISSFTHSLSTAIMRLPQIREKLDENYIKKVIETTFIPETIELNVEEILNKLGNQLK